VGTLRGAAQVLPGDGRRPRRISGCCRRTRSSKRYREVGLHVPLTAGPAATLPGPDPSSCRRVRGLHQILLRVEVSRDRDASDLAGAGAEPVSWQQRDAG
jgi:hypothetical protein